MTKYRNTRTMKMVDSYKSNRNGYHANYSAWIKSIEAGKVPKRAWLG